LEEASERLGDRVLRNAFLSCIAISSTALHNSFSFWAKALDPNKRRIRNPFLIIESYKKAMAKTDY
jgi:hypothetical protein